MNPPWLLLFLQPLAWLPFRVASAVWLFINVFLTGSAVLLSVDLLGLPKDDRRFVFYFTGCLFFGATISSFLIGQISALLVVSLLLGIYWLRHEKDYFAGAAFFLLTVKPQITYLVGLMIVIWIIRHRRWKVFLSAFFCGIISSSIVWLFFPGWIGAYLQILRENPFAGYYTSTLASMGKVLFGTNLFTYTIFLSIPLPFLLQKWLDQNKWGSSVNLVISAGVALSPYGFNFDQVLLIPVWVQCIEWYILHQLKGWRGYLLYIGLPVTALFYLLQLFVSNIPYSYFFWIPIVILGFYLIGLQSTLKKENQL